MIWSRLFDFVSRRSRAWGHFGRFSEILSVRSQLVKGCDESVVLGIHWLNYALKMASDFGKTKCLDIALANQTHSTFF